MLENHPSTHAYALSDACILVVDDDALTRFILADQLAALGCGRVDTAPDGPIALDWALSRPYHLVITDLCMPHMGGQALLAALRAHGLAMPVVAGTAWREPASARASGAPADAWPYRAEPLPGFAAVLRKPFSMTQLRALLHAHLGSTPLDADDPRAQSTAPSALHEAFAAGWPDDERALRAALAVPDADAFLARLHRLHGALAIVKAGRARLACVRLQRDVRRDGIDKNALQIERFLLLCARIGRRANGA
ncbi:response regulator [Trinickia diaoshuihuensis]|uniref:Hpt domain-containing response regulator n=1 Tax=Trinickia diaoshuihuensis TaxID=2292265 RepID=UPI0013C378F3|nr:response regulator [Trinickia diaoshuihuensis]